jgi:hypothetical protein
LSPSPRSSGAAAAALAVLLFARPLHADQARFEAGVSSPADTPGAVRLILRNVGTLAARDVRIEGRLDGQYSRMEAPGSIAAGGQAEAVLRLDASTAAGARRALVLRLDYESVRRDGVALSTSQWAFVLLGSDTAPPPVRVELPALHLSMARAVGIELVSEDGRAHRVHLEVFAPHGFGGVPFRQVVDVPAQGRGRAEVRLLRSSAPNGDDSLLAVATTDGETPSRSAVGAAVIDIAASTGLLPRLRGALVLLAALLAAWSAHAQRRPAVSA